MVIQWYPGHMAKAKRLIKENLKLVDVLIELVDARIPASSRNPDVNEIAGPKPRLVVLNKADLADPDHTRRWKEFFSREGWAAVAVDSVTGKGIKEVPPLVQQLAAPKMAALVAGGRRPRAARCLVLGIPNVGKSFFINKLVGQKVAKTGDKPGVTRGQQWIRVAGNLDLLDTPGILWPKFEDPRTAFRLAATGAIKEEIFDMQEVAGGLIRWLMENSPGVLRERYGLENLPEDPEVVLKAIGARRGFIHQGGIADVLKAAQHVLKEFREGKMGRHTLDLPPNTTKNR